MPQDVLAGLAALGPFFAVSSHPPGADPGPPWRPLRELAGPGEALPRRIESVRAALTDRGSRGGRGSRPGAAIEPRVAASVTHLGLVARLIGPALAASAGRRRLDLPFGGLWWQDTLGGPVPLSVPVRDYPVPGDGSGGGPAGAAVLEHDCRRLLDDVIAPITVAIAALVTVSPRVLWGNVASAVNGAAGQVGAARADLGEQAWTVAAAFFGSPRLAGERRPPGPGFRRSSCCLLYRLAADRAGAVCGDCVLGGRG